MRFCLFPQAKRRAWGDEIGHRFTPVRRLLVSPLVTENCRHGPASAPGKELTGHVTIGVNDEWRIGFGWTTFEEYLDRLFPRGQSLNVAPLVATGAVRLAAMGFDAREPTATELDQ